MGRGQASLELFFTVTLFVLVLLWFNNFLQSTTEHAQDVVLLQQKSLTASIASNINTACLLGVQIAYEMPCLWNGPRPQAYNLELSGRTLRLDQSVEKTACDLNASSMTAFQCGQKACIRPGPPISLSLEACG